MWGIRGWDGFLWKCPAICLTRFSQRVNDVQREKRDVPEKGTSLCLYAIFCDQEPSLSVLPVNSRERISLPSAFT